MALVEKTISAGDTEVPFNVTLIDDAEDEDDEDIVLGITGATEAGQGTNTTHTITLSDSDPAPSVAFSNEDGTGAVEAVDEADGDGVAGSYSIKVVLNYASYQATTATYSVNASSSAEAGGNVYSAEAGDDYYLSGDGSLSFAAGDTEESIDFTIIDDATDEYAEEVIIDLSAGTNCTVGNIGQLVITINDDDAAPVVRFSATADAAGTEGDATQSVEVSITPASGKAVVIPYTINGTSTTTNTGGAADHDLAAASLTIPVSETTGNITFDITQDGIYENSENLIIDLGAPANGSDDNPTGALHATADFIQHTFVIANADPAPSVAFFDDDTSVTEATTPGVFKVQLSALSEVAATVYIEDGSSGTATAGEDYTLNSTEVTIPVGSRTATFEIPIAGDAIDEEDQTFTITLTTPVTDVSLGVQRTQVVTIVDDDDPPLVNIDTDNSTVTINEDGGSATIKFVLNDTDGNSTTSEKTVSVGYLINTDASTATLNQDYSDLAASGAVTFTVGDEDKTFTVPIINDLVDEACLLYTSPSPRDGLLSRMPSSA